MLIVGVMRVGPRLLPLAVPLLSACASSQPPAVPPAIELPVPPSKEARVAKPTMARAAMPAPAATATVPPWVLRVERTTSSKAVAACQIAPVSSSSKVVVEERMRGATGLAMRVVQDDEKATGTTVAPSLLGKGYLAEATEHGIQVATATGDAATAGEESRVRALATTVLEWPGKAIVSAGVSRPGEVSTLDVPLAAIASVTLHGEPATEVKASVHFAAARGAGDTAEDVLTVSITAHHADAGMCHHWESLAKLDGELVIRARDGALVALHLEGTTSDTEGLCQKVNGAPGPPAPPRACTKGSAVVDVRQPDVP